MPGGKEYLVLFELCFCNLRFKFRFLEAPLGIGSELIIASNFLHLVPITSANKPAMATLMTTRDVSKESSKLYTVLLVRIYPLRKNKGKIRLARFGFT